MAEFGDTSGDSTGVATRHKCRLVGNGPMAERRWIVAKNNEVISAICGDVNVKGRRLEAKLCAKRVCEFAGVF